MICKLHSFRPRILYQSKSRAFSAPEAVVPLPVRNGALPQASAAVRAFGAWVYSLRALRIDFRAKEFSNARLRPPRLNEKGLIHEK